MDFREVPIDKCPINYMDTLHLILFILYKRAEVCTNLNLNCMDLPVLATTPLLVRNCERDDVYKFFRRMERVIDKLGNEIEIFRLNKIRALLGISFGKGNIKLYGPYIVNEQDCLRVDCVSVNNVTVLYMNLIIRFSDKNVLIFNVPDIVVWLGKMYGMDMVYKVLSVIHDYVETGKFNENVNEIIKLASKWGVDIDLQGFINGTIPGRRSLGILREIMK
ncbi:hypothetical protein [Vulcanisaeta thermophila]|uniref:hypothetical protein n=1 Tax=Vulcanisaeta thermophila TaxID=867917 RepID=UPI0008538EA0|nr:hypothetical protein [Vulcanisaeta thermophila]